jgi:hypothetical protein
MNDPDAGSVGPPARVELGLSVLNDMMRVHEDLLKRLDSRPSYAEQNLPEDEQQMLKNTRHQLRVLNALYGPKAT